MKKTNLEAIANKLSCYKFYHILAALFLMLTIMAAHYSGLIYVQLASNYIFKFALLLLLVGDIIILASKTEIVHPILYTTVFGIFFLYLILTLDNYTGTDSITMNAYLALVVLSITFIIGLTAWIRTITKDQIVNAIKNNLAVVLICISFIILCIPNYSVWPLIDSYCYYNAAAVRAGTWNVDMLNLDCLSMGGHTAYAFAILLQIGELIDPTLGHGQTTIRLIMSLVTIVAFYKICKKLWRYENNVSIILLTLIFTYSPLFFGISYLTSTDFPLLCFMTLLVYAAVYENKPLKWLSALAVCFSKEVGFVVVVGFWFGEFLYELISKKDGRLSLKKMIYTLFQPKYILCYSAVFCYIFILLFGSGGWITNFHKMFSDTTSELPDWQTYVWWHYPLYKIFEGFFMNFNWIIFPIIAISFVARKKCDKTFKIKSLPNSELQREMFLPICMAFLFFIVCGIAYLTYLHYRYMQCQQIFFVLLLGYIVLNLCPDKKRLRNGMLAVAFCLFLAESYTTIDPVTFAAFDNVNTGNGKTISTRVYWYITTDQETGDGYYWEADTETMNQFCLSVGSEYNRDVLGCQKMLNKAMSAIDYNENKLIILDNFGGWKWNTVVQLFGDEYNDIYLWNHDKQSVVKQGEGIPLNLATDELVCDTSDYDAVYYFDFSFNSYHTNDVLENYDIVSEQTITSGKWQMTVYEIK